MPCIGALAFANRSVDEHVGPDVRGLLVLSVAGAEQLYDAANLGAGLALEGREVDVMTLVAAPRSPRRLSKGGALRVVDPALWARHIRAAMKKCDGRVPEAAAYLKISTRQLFRWLADPLLKDVQRAPTSLHRDED